MRNTDPLICSMDLGGTKSLLCLVNQCGEIEYSVTKSSVYPISSDVTGTLTEWIWELERIRPIACVSIGMAGQIDYLRGRVVGTCYDQALMGLELSRDLSANTGFPVYMINDAAAALIGELWKGAGQGSYHALMVTIGTGLGGAAILDGRMLHGINGAAMQIGHSLFQYGGRLCVCGQQGCTEAYISGTAIRESYAELTSESIPAHQVFARYLCNEPDAVQVLSEFLVWCGAYLASLTNLINPELIILGGGVSEALRPSDISVIQQSMSSHLLAANSGVRIVTARLGNRAGVIGAARHALLPSLNFEKEGSSNADH